MTPRTGRIHLALCLAAVLCVTRAPARAQTPFVSPPAEPARDLKEGKVVHAFRIVSDSPVIDGDLTDEAWTVAEITGDFLQRDPDNGRPMTEATRVQIAYDDTFLYIAVICDDGDPTLIAEGLGRRSAPGSRSRAVNAEKRDDLRPAGLASTAGASGGADANHTFMVKLTYWLNR